MSPFLTPDRDVSARRSVEERMQQAIADAKLDDATACLLIVEVESLHIMRNVYGPELCNSIMSALDDVLSHLDYPAPPVGWSESSRLVLVLPRTDLDRAVTLSEGLIEEARTLDMKVGRHRLRLAVNVGVAHTAHAKDYSFETLMHVATEGAQVASSGGGGQCIHTELYELLQPAAAPVERRPPPPPPPPEPEPEPQAESPGWVEVRPESEVPKDEVGFARVAERPAKPELRPRPSAKPRPGSVEVVPVRRQDEAPSTPKLRAVAPLDETLEAGRVHDSMLEHMIGELFDLHRGGKLSTSELRDRLLGTVTRWSAESRRTLSKELDARKEEELDRLRRRITKLTQRLDDAEDRLRRASVRTTVDEGIASAFRTVQGVSEDDLHYELKKEMMRDILNANLALLGRA